MSFNKLGLNSELLKALNSKGYKSPTPIQEQAIPAVLSGKDIRGAAQTGTGKTAAFTLPILQILSEQKYRSKQPRVLILTPTRELAAQIGDNLDIYGKNLPFRSTTVFGGVNINPQKSELRRGVDIVIATPGRLLDHAGQGSINLSQVQILVLDEADRMLDMGFINDIKKIIRYLPRKRQNLLFSATYSDKIKELSDDLLNNPLEIEVAARNTAAESIQQIVHPVEMNKKRDLLVQLIQEESVFQALVFTRTKYGADKLAKHLNKQGIRSSAIHGNKTQAARTKTLADFKKSKLQILVATDIASRGLDINQLPYVFNYDLPEVAEDYVHRIGRTGRADAEGVAVSFVTGGDQHLLRGIEKLLNKKLELVKIDGFSMGSEAAPQKKQNQPRRNRGFGQPRSNSSSNSYSRKPRQRRERRDQKPKILLVETF